jgi:hypothetical protein
VELDEAKEEDLIATETRFNPETRSTPNTLIMS